MKTLNNFKKQEITNKMISGIKGGIRFTTLSQVERRRIRRQLRRQAITYTDAVITCPLTGLRTYCIEW